MTVFEPVLAAGNACKFFIACKSKLVSASSCVDCSSATSTHSSAVILEQVSLQVTYNALPYSISLYRCSFHSPTNLLLLPFIICTRPIPSLMQVDGIGIASAGYTFFSQAP